jgi:hypothetical protein
VCVKNEHEGPGILLQPGGQGGKAVQETILRPRPFNFFRLAQLNEPDDGGVAPPGSVEQWRKQAYLLSRPKTNGQLLSSQQNSSEYPMSYNEKVHERSYM